MSDTQRLRIADDLLALRRTVGGAVAGGGTAATDARESLARFFRSNPVWMAAIAVGAMAGS